MSDRTRLFLILWVAGFVGILSFLLVDLSTLIASIPQPPGEQPAELPPPVLLKVLTVIQPTVILTVATLVGVSLAHRVGLHAPATEALARRVNASAALRPQIMPGVVAGIAAGIAIVGIWVIAKPFLTPDFIARAEGFNKALPHITRFLYGGLTEEILLRWGFMTFLAWAAWRLLQKGEGPPKAIFVMAAIVVSAIVFGLGHLPIASMLAGALTLPLILYVIIANTIFGIVAGLLYWRRGLEAAMIAHIFAHVVLIAAIHFAL